MKKTFLLLPVFFLFLIFTTATTYATGVQFSGQDLSECSSQKLVTKTIKGKEVPLKDISFVPPDDNICTNLCRYFDIPAQNRKIQKPLGTSTITIDDSTLFTESTCANEEGKTDEDRFLDEVNNPNLSDCITTESYYICKGLGATRGLPKNPKTNQAFIDESVPYISVRFINLSNPTKNAKYFYCLKSKPQDCGEDDWQEAQPRDGIVILSKLCGDGEKTLKEDCTETNQFTSGDWFHAGKTYHVYLSQGKDSKSVSPDDVKADAVFYVTHFYPEIIKPKAETVTNLNTNSTKNGFTLPIILKGRNIKSGKDSNIYNDYWLQVEGLDNDYKSAPRCLVVNANPKPEDGTGEIDMFLSSESKDADGYVFGTLTEGKYLLKIKDGRDLRKNGNTFTCEQNDFTYYFIPLTIASGGETGTIGTAIKDPYGKELGVAIPWSQPRALCDKQDIDQTTGYCKKIPTALGIKISTEPQFFVRDIFTIVLSIGGVAALLFFIRAGYTIMTSAGNKEKVGQAREQITAAITGLIFIILSIAILEFIGINILRIPGFQ